MKKNILLGHLMAIFSVLVWGVTFISTKILLNALTPLEILFYRFLLGWAALWLICPRWLPFSNFQREKLYFLAGLSGVTLYFLLENIALQWTLTANVSVIVSITPFFTAIFAWIIIGDVKPPINFYLGFGMAITGICLISFSGKNMEFNAFGDFLALLAAIAWGFYSIITRKLAVSETSPLVTTRRIFFYGIVLMLPCFLVVPMQAGANELLRYSNWGNLLFLGLGASALCFASWTYSLAQLGTAATSAYIYLVPAITVISASLILHEKLTFFSSIGCCLTFAGLITSEARFLNFLKKYFS